MTTIKKRESTVQTVIDVEAASLVFTVAGAAPDGGARSFTFDTRLVSDEVRAYAVLHGFKQRISDMAAIPRDIKTGHSATPFEKYTAMVELASYYEAGAVEWSRVRAAVDSGGLLVRCLIVVYPKLAETKIREMVEAMKPAERAATLLNDRIKPIADRLRAEAVEHIDSEDLLAQFDELAEDDEEAA